MASPIESEAQTAARDISQIRHDGEPPHVKREVCNNPNGLHERSLQLEIRLLENPVEQYSPKSWLGSSSCFNSDCLLFLPANFSLTDPTAGIFAWRYQLRGREFHNYRAEVVVGWILLGQAQLAYSKIYGKRTKAMRSGPVASAVTACWYPVWFHRVSPLPQVLVMAPLDS